MTVEWFDENFQNQVRLGLNVKEKLLSTKSKFQKIDIFDTERFGRVLTLDDAYMTSEFDEFVYHEMLVHPAMLTAGKPKRVLVIGGGDGGTAREVLKYDVERVVMIEIDGEVVDACKKFLPTIASGFDDPRLDLRIDDGIKYVTETNEKKFDVILLDGTDPIGPGEVLFSEKFFAGVKRMLKADGVMAMQSESPLFFKEVFQETQLRLRKLYKSVHPMFAGVPLYPSGSWSWTWCSNTQNHLSPDKDVQKEIQKTTKYYNADIHEAIFAQPNYVRKMIDSAL